MTERIRNLSRTALFAVMTTAVAAGAGAGPDQTTEGRWSGLDPSGLQTVYVTDRTGMETRGKLVGLDPDSLRLLVDGAERRFDVADVVRIEKRDGLRNGAIIGAIVGVAMGSVAAGLSDCPGDYPGGACAGFRAAALTVSTGVYAAIGTGIDALVRGRSTLYAAPPAGRSATVGGASRGVGVQFVVTWGGTSR